MILACAVNRGLAQPPPERGENGRYSLDSIFNELLTWYRSIRVDLLASSGSFLSAVAHNPVSEVTRILSAIEQGDQKASEELLPLVYAELRRLAAQRLAGEKPGHTLQATALVHEAYLRLVGAEQAERWDSRGHFFGAAAEAMRRILIESARRKNAEKRGGDMQRFEISEVNAVFESTPERLIALDDALNQLDEQEPQAGQLVQLRVFAGLSVEQAADILGMSRATAYRLWTYARAWLRSEMIE